jgi:putative ATP-binding cassette transporter
LAHCYVFDEWAADQDPLFKELFYTRLLPELKARGKLVVVITHDDKYFHLADRLLKLEEGRLEENSILESLTLTSDSTPIPAPACASSDKPPMGEGSPCSLSPEGRGLG